MKRCLFLVTAAATVALAAGAVTAEGGVRPDDRANHGVGALGVHPTEGAVRPDDRANHGAGALHVDRSDGIVRPDDRAVRGAGAFAEPVTVVTRPDDRAWRGTGPEPTTVPVASPSGRGDGGFDWFDASVGAAFAFGLALLLLGGSALLARRQRVAAYS